MPGKPADPDQLRRTAAGVYRSADDRFEVKRSADQWFLLDTGATDELGQPLIHGPMPTLEAVREALPEVRRSAPKAGRRPRKAAG